MLKGLSIIFLVLFIAGCTQSSSSNNTNANLTINDTPIIENETITGTPSVNETSEPLINETILSGAPEYSNITCSSLTDSTMAVTDFTMDSEANAKSVNLCSVNHDIMNSVNYKYYTFTLSEPARVYLMIDGINIGQWQIGILNEEWADGVANNPVTYTADLGVGTHTVYVRLMNHLGSTCVQNEGCYYQFSEQGTQYWINGNEKTKLGFRLTLSTSQVSANNTLETIEVIAPVNNSCSAFNSKTVGLVSHDSVSNAYSASVCDVLSDTFTGVQYQYYSLSLSEETDVKITLHKPEGAWQVGVTDYGWQESTTLSDESVSYMHTLPAGVHNVWVMVTNTAGLSGYDWSCRQVVLDGTCYWINGVPPTGTHYLTYSINFDRQ